MRADVAKDRRGWIIAAVAAGIYAAFSLLRHWQMRTAGYDLGIFDTVVRAYARFQAPIVPLKGDGFNIWGDHFHPILMLLAPLYWIWDDPRMLLLAQAGLVGASVGVVYGFVRRRMSRRVASWLTLGYAFAWPIQSMIAFDFHEIAFAMALLALAIDAFDRERDVVLLACAFALLFVREDMGVIVALLGLLRVVRKPRWPGVVLIVAGTAAFVLVTQVVLPYFSPTGKFAYWDYDALGANAPAAIAYILTHPLSTIALFFTPWIKTATLALIFVPVLLSFRSPLVVLTAPLLAQRFFASREALWQPSFHYNAPIWLIAVLAAADALGRVPEGWRTRLAQVVAAMAAATALVPTIAGVPLMQFRALISPESYRVTDAMVNRRVVLAAIPANTCVSADDRLADKLIRTNRVTLPGISAPRTDFLAIDLSQKTVGTTPTPDPAAVVAEALANHWTERVRSGPIIVLEAPDYAGASKSCRGS